MSCFVYILYAENFDKFYIGQTNDVKGRIIRHNNGYERSTSPFKPWKLMWFTDKPSRAEAMVLERKLKNLSKQRILQFIKKYSQADDEPA